MGSHPSRGPRPPDPTGQQGVIAMGPGAACVFRGKSATDSGMKSATDSDLISAIPI
jgi:hypothetical protein